MDISDHSPIYMSVGLNRKPNSAVWRMNSDILNNSQIKQTLENDIKSYVEINDNEEVSPSTVWDALKAVVRGKIISIISNLKKQQNEHRATMNHKVKQDIKKQLKK